MNTKTGDKRTMRRLLVKIPEDVFRALKFRSVETDTTMRELVTEALRRYLQRPKTEGGEKE
jgi:hypothetical protein